MILSPGGGFLSGGRGFANLAHFTSTLELGFENEYVIYSDGISSKMGFSGAASFIGGFASQ